MSGLEYKILVNDTLKKQLDDLGKPGLERIREKLEFLASGLWDGGLRVKKLKGPARSVVFEARMNQGDRLLFTLGRERGEPVVYAWGIEHHDDVNRAKRSLLPENAPFLSFEPLSVEDREDLAIDTLSPDYYTQEGIDSLSASECGPQRWLVLDNADWTRILESAQGEKSDLRLHLTEEQRKVLEQAPPLFLSGTAGSGKTTIAVYYLFRQLPGVKRRLFVTNHRFLCSYSERLYDGLASGRLSEAILERPRFAPYRDLVRGIVETAGNSARVFDPAKEVDLPTFGRMLRDRKEFSSLDPELAWEEIRGVIKGAKPALNVGRYRALAQRYAAGELPRRETRELEDILASVESLDFMHKIESIMAKKTSFKDYADFMRTHSAGRDEDRSGAVFVHGHILECMERKEADIGRPLLSFPEYQALGKKRAPRFSHDRQGIYAAAEWYQARLRETGAWDEIDMSRRALEIISSGAGKSQAFEPWDLVVCDEAQDFTNIHLYLIFRLASDPSFVVMAGDVKQIINPSGFRWADLRSLFWERGMSPPDLFRLSLNFRSVGGIVALANALLDVKKRLAGIQSDESKETWKFRGKSPCLLVGADENRLIEKLSGAGAGNALIVRDGETRERMKLSVRSELVFTVNEAKGLEFDSALLWKLTPASGEIAALWRRLLTDDALAQSCEARIVHEINAYYVAVTRARNGLVIFEENADFWNQGEFQDLCIRTSDPGILETSWKTISSPQDWGVQGDYYFEREFWRAAAECYRNAQDFTRESLAMGLALFAERRFGEAAALLESAGLADKAAAAYEESGNFRKASPLWEQTGDVERSRRCHARALEKEKDFAGAAMAWFELGDKTAAGRALERGGDDPALGDLYRSMRLWEKAAKCFDKGKRHGDAAECWRKAKDRGKAADSYYAAHEWEAAARYYRLSGNAPKVYECFIRALLYDKAAAESIKSRKIPQAIDVFQRWIRADPAAAATIRAQAMALAVKKPLHAAVRLAALGAHGEAGEAFLKARDYGSALSEFRAVDMHDRMAFCLDQQGDYYAAAIESEHDIGEAKQTVRLLSRYARKGHYGVKVDRARGAKLNEEGQAFEAKQDFQRAANRYMAIVNVKAATRCLLNVDRDGEAFNFFHFNKLFSELGSFIQEKENFRISHAEFMEHARFLPWVARYADFLAQWPYFFQALARYRGEADRNDPEFIEEISAIVPVKRTDSYCMLAQEPWIDIVDFLIRIGHMDALLLLWENGIADSRAVSSSYKNSFLRKMETAASSDHPRAPWFRSLLLMLKTGKQSEGIRAEGIHPWNVMAYCLTTGDYETGVRFYYDQHDDAGLEAFGEYLQAMDLIVAYADAQGNKILAATWCEKDRNWERALDCYRSLGNDSAAARMLEKMGEYREALRIWERLGKKRDIQRATKAVSSGKEGVRTGRKKPTVRDDSLQPELFT